MTRRPKTDRPVGVMGGSTRHEGDETRGGTIVVEPVFELAATPMGSRDEPELTDEQEAFIKAGIAADPDNPELTAEQFARMRPASQVLPPALYAALTKPRGRPRLDNAKIPVKLRLDPATVSAFKATGTGWQTRMNDVLARAAKRLPR